MVSNLLGRVPKVIPGLIRDLPLTAEIPDQAQDD